MVLHNFTVSFYRVVITILHHCHRMLLACLVTAGDRDCLPGLTLYFHALLLLFCLSALPESDHQLA